MDHAFKPATPLYNMAWSVICCDNLPYLLCMTFHKVV